MHLILPFWVIATSLTVRASWYTMPTKLRPITSVSGKEFGISTAIDDTYLIIGNQVGSLNSVTNIGSVIIYTRINAEWEEMMTLVPDDGVDGDGFGSDVGIANNTIIVGNRESSVYIYRYNGTTWLQKEKTTPATTTTCGYSVVIHGDYAAYGCPVDKIVNIHKLNSTLNTYFSGASLNQTLTETDGDFGDSIAIYGNYLAVSSATSVRIYELSANVWTTHFNITLTPYLRKGNLLGPTLSMYGSRLVIASNPTSVKVYKQNGDIWDLEGTISLTDPGMAVDIHNELIIIGSYLSNEYGANSGSTNVYKLVTGNWTLDKTLSAHDIGAGHSFGKYVSLWGGIFVTSAPLDDTNGDGTGAVYIFDNSVATSDIVFSESSSTSLDLSMKFYTSTSFNVESTTPLTVSSHDTIYVGIKEVETNTHFKFIVDHCYATKTADAAATLKDYFFYEKCNVDTTFAIHNSTNDVLNFAITTFMFIQVEKVVFLHCTVYICLSDSSTPLCTQKCHRTSEAFRRGLRKSTIKDGDGVEKEMIISSGMIVFKETAKCIDISCPSNSMCVELYPATCVCNFVSVYSRKTNSCTEHRILKITDLHLNMEWVNTYARKTSMDFLRLSVKIEASLYRLFQKTKADDVINGVKVIEARQGSVVVDVLITYDELTTWQISYETFLACIATNSSVDDGDLKIATEWIPSYTPELSHKTGTTFGRYTPLIVFVVLAIMILIAGTYYLMTRLKQKPEEKKDGGVDNVGIDIDGES